MIRHEDIDNGQLYQKMHKVCCCAEYLCACNLCWYPCRKAVSGNKVRYQEGGFDLDLTYLTPRIIVHGFPATGLEHMYRNPRYEMKRFLEQQHKGHYKVYNFCCEPGRGYDAQIFDDRVERYPFLDHHTPPLHRMVAFADSAYAWLLADKRNVVTLHCKAGKGRAGLMSCVLLMRTGVVTSADEAFKLYDATRVHDGKGLTVTSQRKYVKFFEEIWKKFWEVSSMAAIEPVDSAQFKLPEEPRFKLVTVSLVNTDGTAEEKEALKALTPLTIKVWSVPDYLPELVGNTAEGHLKHEFNCELKGNFKIKITCPGYFKTLTVLEFMHNTLFMRNTCVYFGLSQLDMKKDVQKRLGKQVKLKLEFEPSSAETNSSATTSEAASNGV